jgi:Ca2+-binding RTX toxin-like protein
MATITGSGSGETLNDTIGGGNYFDAAGGADTVNAGDGNDSLFGGGGNDRLFGGTENDALYGGTNVDSLSGGDGNDTLFGGTDGGGGDDTLRGGAGFDYVSYSTVAGGVTVNLATSVASGEGGDVIFEVEGVVGSQGADSITGDTGGNRLIGGAGDDTISAGDGNDTVEGGTGSDTLAGGAGVDTVSFANSATAVNASLATNTSTGEGTDALSGFENLTGSSFSDVLTGDGNANVIDGGLGNDTINGGAGDDSLVGGPEFGTTTATAPVSLDFNWTAAGADEANLAGGVSQDTGGIDVSVSFAPGRAGSTISVESSGTGTGADAPIYVAGGETFNPNSSVELARGGAGTPTQVTVDFASVAGSGFQDEVSNVQFRISDIDTGAFTDQVTIRAYDSEGNEVSVTLTETSGDLSTNGNTVTATGGGTSPNSVDGSVLVSVAGPVARIVIEYTDLDNSFQYIRLSDVQFQALPTIDDDSILGGVGNDTILGGSGNDTLDGGADNDTIFGGSGNDSIRGDIGNDSLSGDDGNDTVEGGLGLDTLYGGAGVDSLSGGDDSDLIYGGNDGDTILGGSGNDTIYGETGSDNVSTGDGNDSIFGGDGNDTLTGGAGFDTMTGGVGADSFVGNQDLDLIDYSASNAGVNVNLGTNTFSGGHATGDSHTGMDGIIGSDFNDTMVGYDGSSTLAADVFTNLFYGGLGDDSLSGLGGDDSLYGGANNDTVLGGSGDDSIYGGTGRDLLYGGIGSDNIFGGDDQDLISMIFADGPTTTLVNESVDGGGGGIDNDTLQVDITGFGWTRINLTYDPLNIENGTITFLASDGFTVVGTLTFTDIENLVIVCFTAGTEIMTDRGAIAVEVLQPGDLVVTRDNGLQPLRWVGTRHVSLTDLLARPELQPVRIGLGALGNAGPVRSTLVSPQHRVLIEGAKAEMYFGESEVLVPAKHLLGTAEVTRAVPSEGVTYVHILFDRHELVLSNGFWTESFQPAERTLSALEDNARDEVLELFPELATNAGAFPAARLSLKSHEARVLVSG